MAVSDIYKVTYRYDKGSHIGNQWQDTVSVAQGTSDVSGAVKTALAAAGRARTGGTLEIMQISTVVKDVLS